MAFKKAQRKNSKLRLAMASPSGGGKTFTALVIAKFLQELLKFQKDPALLDSERSSAEKYAQKPGTPEGPGNWSFDHANLDEKFPQDYLTKIGEAGAAGYEMLIIDSLSHEWTGVLEIVDNAGGWSRGGKTATPLHARVIDAIMTYPGHVIATFRSKTGIDVEKDSSGKTSVKKHGLQPIAREGTEFEFDVWFDFDVSGGFTVGKSRCPSVPPGSAFSRADIPKVIEKIAGWLDEGSPLSPVEEYSRRLKFVQTQADLSAIITEITAALQGGKVSKEEAATLKPTILAKKAELANEGA